MTRQFQLYKNCDLLGLFSTNAGAAQIKFAIISPAGVFLIEASDKMGPLGRRRRQMLHRNQSPAE